MPVLSHWLQRGLGQILAPDPNVPGGKERATSADGNVSPEGSEGNNGPSTGANDATRVTVQDEGDHEEEASDSLLGVGGLWNLVAPDPNFPPAGAISTLASTTANDSSEQTNNVQDVSQSPLAQDAASTAAASPATATDTVDTAIECVHCHKMTSAAKPHSNLRGAATSAASAGLATPPPASSSSSSATPSAAAVPASAKSAAPATTPSFFSPPLAGVGGNSSNNNIQLAESVLSAARSTALALSSPTTIWESRKDFIALCVAPTLNEKKIKRMEKKLKRDPSLAQARATDMGNLVYDGATPLHACAMAGNKEATIVLLGIGTEEEGATSTTNNSTLLTTLDLQGRTPLHVAAEHGQVEVVRILKSAMTSADPNGTAPIGPDAPTDLAGRTPLGWAATSRDANARRNGKELERELFSPGDGSVCGVQTPATDRAGCFGWRWKRPDDGNGDDNVSANKASTPFVAMRSPMPQPSLPALPYGHSEMPGWRVDMEDALLHLYPLPPALDAATSNNSGKRRPPVGIFGVFDGHGDAGTISAFIARTLPDVILESHQWKNYTGGSDGLANMLLTACPIVDEKLKAAAAPGAESGAVDTASLVSVGVIGSTKPPTPTGGSTGVIALIGKGEIVVGNVGDSRCVLVQRKVHNADAEPEGTPVDSEENSDAQAMSEITVKPLSFDHKPNLPEEQARVEKAGLEVIAEVVDESETIHKIQRGPNDKIAVSRAFGDFDYKANSDLPAEQQAIVSTPEIITHTRDSAQDLYLILACDGIWDVMTNEEAGDFVHASVKRLMLEKSRAGLDSATIISETLPTVGDELIYECLRRGSRDNMSVLIVSLAQLSADAQVDDLAENVGRRLELEDEV